MASAPLRPRAKHRLKIAAGLLRGSGRRPKALAVSREGFYEEIQTLIAQLPDDQRQQLKEHTDWVEAYDRALGQEQDSKK